nr:MAG TPA: Portal protein [Caudoviricetes sp.]
MARRNRKLDVEGLSSIDSDRSFKKQLININNLIGQANLSLYGTDRTSDVDSLNDKFQSILSNELTGITGKEGNDITSFLSQVVSADNKYRAGEDILNNQFNDLTGNEYSSMQSFIYDAYRNRLLQQADLHEVSSQLIELAEAIMITRDAIISADTVEGRLNRTINFENIDDDEVDNYNSIVENMENKFQLLEKIKNFIIPKTLEYGEYYVYIVPYSELFNKFQQQKTRNVTNTGILRKYAESTVLEGFDDTKKENKLSELDMFLEDCYNKYHMRENSKYSDKKSSDTKINKDEFKTDLKNIMENIIISTDDIPIPFLEEGLESIEYISNQHNNVVTEDNNLFKKVIKNQKSDGGVKISKKGEFDDIGDCYLKMIEPTRIIPIKIMNTTLGYYYVQDEDITPLSGAVSSSLYFSRFNEHSRQQTIIDSLAERVVQQFNKPFLKNNLKFKEAIVDCFNYYNLNENRVKMQFIPAEYIVSFKIDEDIDGNGTSMIKKSLFYAKLYLMILLFKIMSIIMYSNDQKINYIKQSGLDKNLANRVQEIARLQQSRQVNISDLFSYTTLINKVGNGNAVYMPTGRSGERPIETEILSGQDVQLNNDLLEMLKNAYITGTGVPAAILNYLNEADYAKTVEQNNSKFNARVINYQLDFNPIITDMYKRIMRWSTNIGEEKISNFNFSLTQPRSATANAKAELISQFNTMTEFLTGLLYPDPGQAENPDNLNAEIREFKKLYAREQLPMIDFDSIEELINKASLLNKERKLKPDPKNGNDGDDDGLEDDSLDDLHM